MTGLYLSCYSKSCRLGQISNSPCNTLYPVSYIGSLGASRENTPPYRSVSYPPNVSETGENKSPMRSASWTSEVPVMPPLSVNVNLGPDMSRFSLVLVDITFYFIFTTD